MWSFCFPFFVSFDFYRKNKIPSFTSSPSLWWDRHRRFRFAPSHQKDLLFLDGRRNQIISEEEGEEERWDFVGYHGWGSLFALSLSLHDVMWWSSHQSLFLWSHSFTPTLAFFLIWWSHIYIFFLAAKMISSCLSLLSLWFILFSLALFLSEDKVARSFFSFTNQDIRSKRANERERTKEGRERIDRPNDGEKDGGRRTSTSRNCSTEREQHENCEKCGNWLTGGCYKRGRLCECVSRLSPA